MPWHLKTTSTPAAWLRQQLSEPGIIVAPGVYDGVSAALAEQHGFSAVYMTGGGAAVSALGLPDLGLATQTEMVTHAQRLTENLSVPLIADADTGYGDVLGAVRTVRLYERAGVAALHLEDQQFPKRCGHLPGKQVVPVEEFEDKLRAVCEARRDPDFVVIARTDSRGPLGLDEAIRRGNRYAGAGADMIFVEAPESEDELARIAKEVNAPLLVNVIANSVTPPVPLARLEELGFKIAIFPSVALSAATVAADRALRHLAEAGTDAWDEPTLSPGEQFRMVGLDAWMDLRARHSADGSS
jgi:2-methylisocitrate lyase-like PEP mutase family enzyme